MNRLQRMIAVLTAGGLVALACFAPWSIRTGSGANSSTRIQLAPLWNPPSPGSGYYGSNRNENVSLHYWSLLAEAALVLAIGAVLWFACKSPPGTQPLFKAIDVTPLVRKALLLAAVLSAVGAGAGSFIALAQHLEAKRAKEAARILDDQTAGIWKRADVSRDTTNEIVRLIRSKYPEYVNISDDELTVRFGRKYPQFLAGGLPQFQKDFVRLTVPANNHAGSPGAPRYPTDNVVIKIRNLDIGNEVEFPNPPPGFRRVITTTPTEIEVEPVESTTAAPK